MQEVASLKDTVAEKAIERLFSAAEAFTARGEHLRREVASVKDACGAIVKASESSKRPLESDGDEEGAETPKACGPPGSS